MEIEAGLDVLYFASSVLRSYSASAMALGLGAEWH